MNIDYNVSLSQLNTLGIPSVARQFCRLSEPQQLSEVWHCAAASSLPVRVLGGGSNLMMANDVEAFVIKNELKGIEVVTEDSESVVLSVRAGENWHQFILYCLDNGYHGLENLALIPGTVGAAPVQNIGAYGVEVGTRIERVFAMDLTDGQRVEFDQAACNFRYRDSFFKQHENRFLITEVQMRLSRRFEPLLSYGPLQALSGNRDLSAKDVVERVIQIRQEKLPDPAHLPNAGSFFKNPIVSQQTLQRLLAVYEDLPYFQVGTEAKLAAGWLIDQAGYKGKSSKAGVGCYQKQALVIVNPERASFSEVASWSAQVCQSVLEKFDVALEEEPRRWL